jgi:hypothetical protein
VKQPIKAFGPHALGTLTQSFRANQYNMRQQMIETAILTALGPQKETLRTAGQPGDGGIPQT